MRAEALAVMAKAPVPGQVKTRLIPALGARRAAHLADVLLRDQLAQVQRACGADLYLAFAPPAARAVIETIAPPGWTCFAQKGHGLGARMRAVFADLFAAGHRSVVLIGGDLPAVPRPTLAKAFAFLRSDLRRVVLGPARDGGYYLVGCNCPTPEIFTGMRWSRPAVLACTRKRLDALGIQYHLLPEWFDIDTVDDLAALRSALQGPLAGSMPRTCRFLRRLKQK
jgi:rSAM/selenodomain-associated transferase 1